MFNNLYNYFFSPLTVENCDYFLFVSIFSLLIFLFMIITILSNLRKTGFQIAYILAAVSSPLVSYYTNRLFYSICINSLKN
jgi:hypothetical protein